ncbi:hypothetical protein [Polyangium sp. 15x6]|uniref:hypothetical protein n=1 Tax=Polyangium sp. 15x6 TaxID=3042687 RepID=UPI002499E2E3|nr:hypothetical protein [Polyangium sp. 15x6]MDI3289368.1 hypothetical protein [Polyangium sp. 15x6]
MRNLAFSLFTTFTALALAACGGNDPGGSGGSGGDGGSAGAGGHNPLGETFTRVVVVDRSGGASERQDVLVTFAHPFAVGDVPSGATVGARIEGVDVPLQVDAKATHADGSLRHAVLTARIPKLPGSGSTTLELYPAEAGEDDASVSASDLLATTFDAKVSVDLAGAHYEASARSLLEAKVGPAWLDGPLVSEWSVVAPVAGTGGEHPHLTARFDVRAYAGKPSVLVSVTVENDWTYEPNPQNFTYDLAIDTDKESVYTKSGLVHLRKARWRKAFWWGEDPQVHVEHDVPYLLSTGAVPHFDPTLVPAEAALANLDTAYGAKAYEPMGIGLAEEYMPQTGGRTDIGPMPGWSAMWLLSMDERAKRATLGTADGAGSWPIHYRDKVTDRIVSLEDHAYMTLLGNPGDAVNPETGVSDAFPPCGGDCSSPYEPDSAHQPALVYLPYLLTGDRYYLEELQFWANFNMLQSNPGYRENRKGLVQFDQTRGQAWSLRTLGQAAYITPDDDPMKKYFTDRVGYNIEWYKKNYIDNPDANLLGILTNGYSLYDDGTMAPWMDDFFTWSVGHLVSLGFEDARPLLEYKSKFPVGRMIGPDFCWIFGSVYHLPVKDTAQNKFFTTFAEAYQASVVHEGHPEVASMACGGPEMGAALMLQAGEMVGYSPSTQGYPSNMQPALAAAVESKIPGAQEAWDVFMARSVKPDYSTEPQFAVVPRP